ncbi:MAG: hypothetical protein M5U12_29130 [Verrucomicrobia bacterium]|nr:hypothetical protein [Verrucomicrobiota bacterium]
MDVVTEILVPRDAVRTARREGRLAIHLSHRGGVELGGDPTDERV